MKTLASSPAFLLLVVGTLVGLNFPLGKIAGEAGISPLIWALTVSLGASVLLLPSLLFKGHLQVPTGAMARYVIISALISFVLPNILLLNVIIHTGSGYTGLMFALSPVFTLAIAVSFKMQGPNALGLVGIGMGLAGALIVALARGSVPDAPPLLWIMAALLIPFLLACGNVYRSLDWPPQASPDALAFWAHAFSVLVFLVLIALTKGEVSFEEFSRAPSAVLAQGLVAGMTFPVFFRLQQKGGPVFLSQLGYVSAAVGLIAATFFLGERYSMLTWAGAAAITLGIAITITAQQKEVHVKAIEEG